jgi:hypothetical protein
MLLEAVGSVMGVASGLEYVTKLYKALAPAFHKLVQSRSDRFLNYDPGFLFDSYPGERPIVNGVAYTEICDFCKLAPPSEAWDDKAVVIRTARAPFSRSSGAANWQGTSAAGYTALRDSGRIGSDELTIRVFDTRVAQRRLYLRVQRATYHDQAHSNLILDFDRDKPGAYPSLRSQLLARDSGHLPRLGDRRLANTLGVAALVFYTSNGQWIPYMVRRVKKVGVFPGGLHCTASGVAKWPPAPDNKTLSNFATEHMLYEIEEEVGLKGEDLIDLRPLALCREMARGGKPQLFYGGFTLLDRQALRQRRKHAHEVISETNQWAEIERDRWFRSADVVPSPHKLPARLGRWGLTLEAAASLHLGIRYAKARVPHLNVRT